MPVRDLNQLKYAQARLLEDYKAQREQAEPAASADSPADPASATIGRVTKVVTFDPEWGPHLLVTEQVFAGTPPAPNDAADTERLYYPTPNRGVTEYATDEYVLLLRVEGARLAAKLA